MQLLRLVPLALLAGCAGTGLSVTFEPYEGNGPTPSAQATATAAIAPTKLPEISIPYKKHILPNGLTLVVHEDHSAPIVAVSTWYHVGSKDEQPGKTGFAHLFEHLMFQNSENLRGEYFQPFEKAGATDMNGTTSFDRTNYFETVPSSALDMALWMESDRMGHLLGAIDQKVLDEQRGVVQNEKRQNYDNTPYGSVWELLFRASFPEGHPYHWLPIGSMKDLDAASLADVKDWFKTYYGTANVTLVLAGDIDSKTALEKVSRYFGDIPAGPPLPRRKAWVAARTESTREETQDRVPQVRVIKSWNTPPDGSDDGALLLLAAQILGGGKTSRLYERLVHRERLVDSVDASQEQLEIAGLFTISADVKKGVDPAKVEAIIEEEVARLLRDGPSASELASVQTDNYADFARSVDRVGGGSGKAAILAGGQVFHDDPATYQQEWQRIARATPQSVRTAGQRWLAKGDYTLTVRPFPEYTTAASGVDRKNGPPLVTQFPDLSFPGLQRATLRNGLRLVLAERHDAPLVEMQLLFDGGYAADQGRKLGTSALTMTMLDEGTTDMGALEIAQRSQELGASVRGDSNLDGSSVRLSALKARLKDSLALYADVVRNPAFDDKEFERVRAQWLAQIAQEKSDADSLALRLAPPLLYGPGHAYAIPFTGTGTEESLRALTPEDLRSFHREWLRPDNATLLIAGDTSLAEIVPMLEAVFGDWKAPAGPLPRKNTAEVAQPAAARVFLIDKPGAAQSQIVGGLIAPSSKAPNFVELGTMNGVFGGSFTSRINMNLREDKHWSYGSSVNQPGALGPRPYMIMAPVQTDKTAESVQELLKEARAFVGSKPATAEEIAKIKNRNIRSLPGRYETMPSLLGALSEIVQYGRPDDYVQTLKAVTEAQKDDDIRAAAREVIKPEQITWVIVGDLAKIEEPIRKLNLGEVKVLDADGKPVR